MFQEQSHFFMQLQCLSIQSFFVPPLLRVIPPMSEQPTLQSFFSVVLHTQAQLTLLDNMKDNLLGVGDFLSDQAHPQHEAVEEVRRSFRTLRRTLKFLLAIQLGKPPAICKCT